MQKETLTNEDQGFTHYDGTVKIGLGVSAHYAQHP